MPKQVDHVQRRSEIAEATSRLIAERGIDATTMREISAAIGMANGALTRYYPGKNAIVQTAFTHVFDATNARIRARLNGATGLDGLRVFCGEAMPVEDITRLEARVVLPFWQRALADAGLASVFAAAMDLWRGQILAFLREGRVDGSVRDEAVSEVVVEQLLAMLMGVQALAVLTPEATCPDLQRAMIESFLGGLG